MAELKSSTVFGNLSVTGGIDTSSLMVNGQPVDGGSNSLTAIYTAGEAITDRQVVAVNTSEEVVIASKLTEATSNVVGFALNSAASLGEVEVHKVGLLDGFTGLQLGLPVFLGNGGAVIQDPNLILEEQARVFLGYAKSATTIDVLLTEGTIVGFDNKYWDSVPLGGLIFNSTDYVREGYLRPQGQALSRANYSELHTLYAAEGYPHGAGDGSTTFNIPSYSDPTLLIKVRNVEAKSDVEQVAVDQRLTDLENIHSDIAGISASYSVVGSDHNIEIESLTENATILLPVSSTFTPGTPISIFMNRKEYGLTTFGDCETTNPPRIQGDDTPITLVNATWARSSEQSYSGSYSYKLTRNANAASEAYASLYDIESSTDMHGFIAGQVYELSCKIFTPSLAYNPKIRFYYYVAGVWRSVNAIITSGIVNQWVEITIKVQIPSSATGVLLRPQMDGGVLGDYAYFDDFKIRRPYTVSVRSSVGQSIMNRPVVLLENNGNEVVLIAREDGYSIREYAGSGHNSNGKWVRDKFGNQTVSQFHSVTFEVSTNSANQVTWVYPIIFRNATNLSIRVGNISSGLHWDTTDVKHGNPAAAVTSINLQNATLCNEAQLVFRANSHLASAGSYSTAIAVHVDGEW